MELEVCKIVTEILVQLKYSEVKPKTGICSYVEDRLMIITSDPEWSQVYRWWINRSRGFFWSWPEFSGSDVFPVPGPAGYDPTAAYEFFDKWYGEYGESRMRLLDFIISKFQELNNV